MKKYYKGKIMTGFTDSLDDKNVMATLSNVTSTPCITRRQLE